MTPLRKQFAILALTGIGILPATTACGQQPRDEYEEFKDVFYEILSLTARNSVSNPDIAKVGMNVLRVMVDSVNAVTPDTTDNISLREISSGTTPSINKVEELFETLPSEAAKAGATRKQLAEFGFGALNDALTQIDPHTNYFSPRVFQEFMTQMGKPYAGIGASIGKDEKVPGPIEIKRVYENTPAAGAGLQKGDSITHINGAPVDSLTIEQGTDQIRGTPGTDVKLTIKRGNAAPFDVDVTRRTVELTSVDEVRLIGNVGYISLETFGDRSAADIQQAVIKLQRDAGRELEGYILDLRFNGGGRLDQANAIVDHFLDSRGDIVVKKTRQEADTTRATPGDILGGKPLIVLTNQLSASASEVVAGALQDHNRALILGNQSYGKGSVQSLYNLGLHGFKVTTAHYYRPNGTTVHGIGITPDIRFDGPGSNLELKNKDKLTNPDGTLPDLARTFAVCSPAANAPTDKAALFRDSNIPDWQLQCALENLRKSPALTNTTPVPKPPTQ